MSDQDKFDKRVEKSVKWAEKQMEPDKPKNPGGRPTDYKPEYADQAKNYCLLGATDKDLAVFFGVRESTINNWKQAHPEFFESIKEAKTISDEKVVRSLYERATGYSHPEDKIFLHEGSEVIVPTTKHYPPDPTSMIFWLKNRQSKDWRDKHELDMNANFKVKIEGKDADML